MGKLLLEKKKASERRQKSKERRLLKCTTTSNEIWQMDMCHQKDTIFLPVSFYGDPKGPFFCIRDLSSFENSASHLSQKSHRGFKTKVQKTPCEKVRGKNYIPLHIGYIHIGVVEM